MALRKAVLAGGIVAFICGHVATSTAIAWTPPAPKYGVKQVVNYPFEASDGTTLMTSVYYPADPSTGERAPGRFPVLVIVTPYGMLFGNSGQGVNPQDDQILSFFATHGYIGVVMDARGTGRSAGVYSFIDPQQNRDHLELIDFVAHRLDGSNGSVGLTGMSYRGMNQLLVGGLLRPGTPVKAMAPSSAGTHMYDRPFFMGGIPGVFLGAYQGLETASEVPPPDQVAASGGADLYHLGQLALDRPHDVTYHAEIASSIYSGGSMAHDDAWWQARDPIHSTRAIVEAGVPVLLTSGANDFFASQSLRMYAALQSVAHGSTPFAPMEPEWRPDPRFQLVWSDTYFDGDIPFYLGYELQWYDHWLKGIDNGVGQPGTTLHIQQHGGGDAWLRVPNSTYPITRRYSPYHLSSDSLSEDTPQSGAETLTWGPDQKLTYTTKPFAQGATVAGPITATIFAGSSTPDLELVATLYDVAPDGTASTVIPALTVDGALSGYHRATDSERNWTDEEGRIILPYHPFTSTSAAPVPTGDVQRYDIEMLPRMWALQPGHSLRLVLASQDPILTPTGPQLQRLAGGAYTIQYGDRSGSYLNLPLMPAGALAPGSDPSKVGLAADVPIVFSPSPRKCVSRRRFSIRLRRPDGTRIRSAKVKVNGKKVATRIRRGRVVAVVDLRGLPKGRFVVRVSATLTNGRVVRDTRRYRTCQPKRKKARREAR